MSNKTLNLNFSGVLMKHSSVRKKENVLVQSQIKCCDAAEVRDIVRELDKYGVENLAACVPATDIPWSPKLPVPLNDYDIYVEVLFGADVYTGEGGEKFKAKLTDISFVYKPRGDESVLECTLSLLKNPDEDIGDTRFNNIYWKYKDVNPVTFKKELKPFAVQMTQIDGFVLGAPEEEDEDEEEDGVIPVYSAK